MRAARFKTAAQIAIGEALTPALSRREREQEGLSAFGQLSRYDLIIKKSCQHILDVRKQLLIL